MNRNSFKVCMGCILILVITAILTGCASPSVTSPVLPESTSAASTASTNISTTPANTEFARMLGYIPYSFLEEHDIWFSNPEKAKQIYGLENISSYQEILSLPVQDQREISSDLSGIAYPLYSQSYRYDMAQLMGFDDWMADRLVLGNG